MKPIILVLLLASCVAGSLAAETRKPSFFVPIINTVAQDTNRWVIAEDNVGRFVVGGTNGGATWPKGSNHLYIFGAGIWVGAMDTTDRDTVVAIGYNPNSGRSYFGPCLPNGDTTGAGSDSLARIYRSDIPRDTSQWPERDSLGRAVYRSHQDLWANSSGLYGYTGFPPVGITSIRRSLAWRSPGPWGDIVKMEFEVKNVTGRYQPPARTLRKVIVGFCMDADIGNESGSNANDLCYLDRTTGNPYPNVGAQYQIAQEPGWGPPPYFEGFKFVSGPANNTGDTLRIRSDSALGYPQYDRDVLPGDPLGMTAFQVYTIAIDPQTPGACYLQLSGRDYRTPQIYNAYQKDLAGPGDKRLLLACGPFDLPNDSIVKLVIHIIGANDSLDLIRKGELLGVEAPPGPVARNASGVVLYPSVPNPTSGPCLIRYALPEPTHVSLKIYDVAGRLVRNLDRGERPAGVHSIRWDGRNGAGLLVPGGVYLYRLEAGGLTQTRSVVLLR